MGIIESKLVHIYAAPFIRAENLSHTCVMFRGVKLRSSIENALTLEDVVSLSIIFNDRLYPVERSQLLSLHVQMII